MSTYKQDHGRLARMFAFWSLVFFLAFGCKFLHTQLISNFDSLETAFGGEIPIVKVAVNGAFLISTGVFVLGLVFLLRWQRKERVADFLIDTEGELRKVTWPTMPDVVNSSIVVIVCVLILMGFMAATDWFFGRIARNLFIG
jgi:preprotein translocase SecE subunit